MNMDEALQFVEQLLAQHGQRLNDLERKIFQGAWQGQTYKEIHRHHKLHVSPDHMMRNVGPELWRKLREAVGEPIRIKDLQGPIQRAYQTAGRSLVQSIAPMPATAAPAIATPAPSLLGHKTQVDWGIAPDIGGFCGRDRELAELQERIELDRCRLVLLWGIAGIGKTQLAIRLVQKLQEDQFDVVIWRSFNCESSLALLLDDLLRTLHRLLPNINPTSSDHLTNLWQYLGQHRCLIVLDGLELVLPSGAEQSQPPSDWKAYATFLRRLSEVYHTSCVVLTSRERSQAIATSGRGDNAPVYSCWVEALGEQAAREMLASKFSLSGSDRDWSLLIRLYTGNPFALNVAASKIQDLYEGETSQFLEVHATETAIFGEIRKLLKQQFARLTHQELAILNWLAQIEEPVPRTRILAEITPSFSNEQLDQGLQGLMWRSLLTLENAYYSLNPLVQEYAQECLEQPNSQHYEAG